jgi:glycine cleavage system H protein
VSDTSDAVPQDRHYTTDHEWVFMEGDVAVVGITYFAQDQLGDVVYVDLPAVGSSIEEGQPFGEVESTKSVSDLFAPMDGTIEARNDELDESPELVNEDPYGDGWLVRVTVGEGFDPSGLLDADAYTAHLDG